MSGGGAAAGSRVGECNVDTPEALRVGGRGVGTPVGRRASARTPAAGPSLYSSKTQYAGEGGSQKECTGGHDEAGARQPRCRSGARAQACAGRPRLLTPRQHVRCRSFATPAPAARNPLTTRPQTRCSSAPHTAWPARRVDLRGERGGGAAGGRPWAGGTPHAWPRNARQQHKCCDILLCRALLPRWRNQRVTQHDRRQPQRPPSSSYSMMNRPASTSALPL